MTAAPAATTPRLLPRLLAVSAGVLITLSFAPYALWPAGIAGVGLLAAVLQRCTTAEAALRGWLFGLGLFGSGTSWVYVSIHLYGGASVALAALLTALFCAGLALLPALFAASYARWVRALPGGVLLGLPALWVLFEWLRSWLLTGFPWLYLGYAHIDSWLGGWAPVAGIYGVSLLTALSGCCLFLGARALWRGPRPLLLSLLGHTVLLAGIWLGGAGLRGMEWVLPASQQPLRVALYQPNIPQERKWDRSYYPEILARYEQALLPALGHDIIVWPEAAIPRLYTAAQGFLEPLARQAAIAGSTLISGIPTRAHSGALHNSIVALGQGEGVYHKQRLVPFGEYVPLEQWLRGLIAFFDLPMSNFSRGPDGQAPLRAGGHRVAPLICYEVVYPQLVAEAARDAELLLTVSNDTWFGASAGPLQHLQMARMRALENGRYLLRGTNNGVSAIIDHRGKVLARSEQFVETTVYGEAQLMLGRTPFGLLGSLPVLLGCALVLLLMPVSQRLISHGSRPGAATD